MSNARPVLITGGSRGLGAGIVKAFLDQGDAVATCSRSPTELTDQWAQAYGERFHFEPLDVRRY
jgi:3-oxoacyl-[acyl-carrier protein] reductase